MIFFSTQTHGLRKVVGTMLMAISVSTVPFVHAETESHDIAYQRAMNKVAVGYQQLSEELDRIHYGAVAHFDFLQYEHFEVMRHARALRHPPSNIDMALRESIIQHAIEVSTAAESMELALSDFLRSHALMDSAISNTLDIVQQAGQGSEGPIQAALQDLASAATHFSDNMQPQGLQSLELAFENVSKTGSVSQDYRDALVLQQGLIAANSGAYERAVAEIEASGLARALESLKAIYSEAGNRIALR